MPIAIPTTRGWRRATPEFIDAGVEQRPSTGLGVRQRLERLGSRWALTVELAPVREGPEWLDFAVALLQARSEGATYAFPQPGLITNTPAVGSPVIAGAGQTGSTLNLSGIGFAYQVRKGQFLSVTRGARRYLYQCMALTSASGGAAAVPIWPMLRASPDNGSAVELVTPVISGSVTRDNFSWEHGFTPLMPLTFRIEEDA
jgi:hypothetical protein